MAILQRPLWLRSRKLAEKELGHAKRLISSHEPTDIHFALCMLNNVLKLSPQWEKALELKARALICLRRFKDVTDLLQDFIPSLKPYPRIRDSHVDEENVQLLLGYNHSSAPLNQNKPKMASLFHCFSFAPLNWKVWVRFSKKQETGQWRYIVLGQACCHLGMMEDAMILLSNAKKAVSAAWREQSNLMREDSFGLEMTFASDSVLAAHLLGNIKLLVRRRTAALAALEAGLYCEAIRHFSKIIDGKRGTPQGFVAECYMHRAIAYQAANRAVDAIADCNRSLALNPFCVETLSTRASIYEAIGCLSECLHDLEQLKALYETVLHNYSKQDLYVLRQPQVIQASDFEGCIDLISSKIVNIQERMKGRIWMDYHRILGVSLRTCKADVERAYILLYLKHRPDKSAHFVDRCDLVDERDIETVKDEARLLGVKLFGLIQQAYSGVMGQVLEEQMKNEKTIRIGKANDGVSLIRWTDAGSINNRQTSHDSVEVFRHQHEESEEVNGDLTVSASEQEMSWLQTHDGLKYNDEQLALYVGPTSEKIAHMEPKLALPFHAVGDVGGHRDVIFFSKISACRELVNVDSSKSQGIAADTWMGATEWAQPTLCPPLSVT